MDIELKEKEEERRARIARKNCKLININLKNINRYKRNRRSKTKSIYFFW